MFFREMFFREGVGAVVQYNRRMHGLMSFRAVPGYAWKRWATPFHELLSWSMSSHLLRQRFRTTRFVTSTAGKKMLVDKLGLQFDDVTIAFDDMPSAFDDFWAFSKLMAEAMQTEPFMHIDEDVFLWEDLPVDIFQAPVIVQSYEPLLAEIYHLTDIEQKLKYLPPAWAYGRKLTNAICAGVVGGTDLEFFRDYVQQATEFVAHPSNLEPWQRLDRHFGMCVAEQYLLLAVATQRGVKVRRLIQSDIYSKAGSEEANALGYTHIWGAKPRPATARLVEDYARRYFPAMVEQCSRIAQDELGYQPGKPPPADRPDQCVNCI